MRLSLIAPAVMLIFGGLVYLRHLVRHDGPRHQFVSVLLAFELGAMFLANAVLQLGEAAVWVTLFFGVNIVVTLGVFLRLLFGEGGSRKKA